MKKHAIMVLDTETCNITPCDAVTRGNNLTYDIGYAVVYPSTGEVIYSSSNVVSEIFFGEREKMQSAYYANKLPQYYDDLANNRRTARSFFEIMNEIAKLCREYNIIAICAHNAAFDIDALNTTVRYLTGLDYVRALPNIEVWDSMKMAKTFAKTPSYIKFCNENGFMTAHKTPRPRMTAEVLYRFIINDLTFEESHTALEDVMIEKEIVAKAYRTHKKMERVLYNKR